MDALEVAPYADPEVTPRVRVKPIAAGRLAVLAANVRSGVNIPILGYLVETPDALIAVDCGLAGRWAREPEVHEAPDDSPAPGTRYQPELEGPTFAEQVRALGLRPDRLVCTHLHLDHAGGAAELGLPLEAAAAELERLQRPDAHALGVPVEDLAGVSTKPIALDGPPFGACPRSAEVAPGIFALDTSGHTPGSISIFCCVGPWGLICGDAVYPKLDEPESPAFRGALRIRRMLQDWPGMAIMAAHDPGVLRAAGDGWLGAQAH